MFHRIQQWNYLGDIFDANSILLIGIGVFRWSIPSWMSFSSCGFHRVSLFQLSCQINVRRFVQNSPWLWFHDQHLFYAGSIVMSPFFPDSGILCLFLCQSYKRPNIFIFFFKEFVFGFIVFSIVLSQMSLISALTFISFLLFALDFLVFPNFSRWKLGLLIWDLFLPLNIYCYKFPFNYCFSCISHILIHFNSCSYQNVFWFSLRIFPAKTLVGKGKGRDILAYTYATHMPHLHCEGNWQAQAWVPPWLHLFGGQLGQGYRQGHSPQTALGFG